MYTVICSYQERELNKDIIKRLEAVIKDVYRRTFGAKTKVLIIWMKIPAGNAFVAGKPSTATAVMAAVDDGFDKDKREAFLADFCQVWSQTAGCTLDEIMLNATDKKQVRAAMKAQRSRFSSKAGSKVNFKYAVSLLKSKLQKGYLEMSVNVQ